MRRLEWRSGRHTLKHCFAARKRVKDEGRKEEKQGDRRSTEEKG